MKHQWGPLCFVVGLNTFMHKSKHCFKSHVEKKTLSTLSKRPPPPPQHTHPYMQAFSQLPPLWQGHQGVKWSVRKPPVLCAARLRKKGIVGSCCLQGWWWGGGVSVEKRGGWVAGAGGSRWRATLWGPSAGIQRKSEGGDDGAVGGKDEDGGRGWYGDWRGTAPKVPAGIRRERQRWGALVETGW